MLNTTRPSLRMLFVVVDVVRFAVREQEQQAVLRRLDGRIEVAEFAMPTMK